MQIIKKFSGNEKEFTSIDRHFPTPKSMNDAILFNDIMHLEAESKVNTAFLVTKVELETRTLQLPLSFIDNNCTYLKISGEDLSV